MSSKINLGSVRFRDRGTWVKGYTFTSELDGSAKTGYIMGDVVQHAGSVYSSLTDGNTAEPGTDTTKWSVWVDGSGIAPAVKLAANATESANAAAKSAANAATKANNAAASLTELNTTSQAATQSCTEATQAAEEKTEEMDTLMKSFSGEAQAPPVKMEVNAPASISTSNKTAQKIAVTLYPGYVMKNVLFHREEGSSLRVDPSGNLKVTGIGTTTFYVIPTMNTELWKEVSITVRTPLLRLTGSGKMRLNGTKMRIV